MIPQTIHLIRIFFHPFSKSRWSWIGTGTKLQQETMKNQLPQTQSLRNESDQAVILVMKRTLVTDCDVKLT
jgi:hypothetical protein